jgi:hypothetical protein
MTGIYMETIDYKLIGTICDDMSIHFTYDDELRQIYFNWNSDAGEDVNLEFSADDISSIEELSDLIKQEYDNYDVGYETLLWLDNFGHGKNGAPDYIGDIVADKEATKAKIKSLAEELSLVPTI